MAFGSCLAAPGSRRTSTTQEAERPSRLPHPEDPLGLGPHLVSATALRMDSAPGKDGLLTHAVGPLLLSLLVESRRPVGSASIAPSKWAPGRLSSAGNLGHSPQCGVPTSADGAGAGQGQGGGGGSWTALCLLPILVFIARPSVFGLWKYQTHL